MKITYLPNLGVEINSEKINWNESRQNVRMKLKNNHKEVDEVFDNSEYFDGDSSFNITIKRDIYQNFNKNENLFFFNYNEENNLSEIEFHSGIELIIENKEIVIGENINETLVKLGNNFSKKEDGNYSFKELKLNLANGEFMGGDGNGIAYIYITKDEVENE